MKRLLIPLLLAPGVAMAGLVIVDQVPAAEKAKQLLAAQKMQLASIKPTVIGQAVAGPVPTAAIVPVEVVPAPKWTIEKGQPIHVALEAWAKSAGWSLIWYPSVSWKSISNAEMKDQKDVVAAISEVVTILRDEGKPIQLRVSEGNNVMEVLSTEVKND